MTYSIRRRVASDDLTEDEVEDLEWAAASERNDRDRDRDAALEATTIPELEYRNENP